MNNIMQFLSEDWKKDLGTREQFESGQKIMCSKCDDRGMIQDSKYSSHSCDCGKNRMELKNLTPEQKELWRKWYGISKGDIIEMWNEISKGH